MSSFIRIASMHNKAEFVVHLIRENCNNKDDLSKILLSVEAMLEALDDEAQPVSLKQLLVRDKTTEIVV